MAKLFFVGDSTVSSFNDVTYYYPRYGYGTQMYRYFDIEIRNLALSGRSSKSFLKEKNYEILKEELSSFDYLVIGFGHNDQKDDDPARFTSALLPLNDENSFSYSIYENYVRLALERGAIPILCTPVPRIDPKNEYKGTVIHETKNGSYTKVLKDLAEKLGILCVDLTTPSVELFKPMGFDKAVYYHAITGGSLKNGELIPNPITVDKTHLNMLGAAWTAYFFACAIQKSTHSLKKYLKEVIEPNGDILKKNPEFKIIPYKQPTLKDYTPSAPFETEDKSWFGTVFGDTDISPMDAGLCAKQKEGSFYVGQENNASHGKLVATADGIAFLFRQVPISENFILTATMEILKAPATKQGGFGIMLRDDSYINEESKRPIATNYIAAGFLTQDDSTNIIFSRDNPVEIKREKNVIPYLPQVGDTARLSLKRLGQAVMVSVVYKDIEYKKTYIDFDLTSTDKDYVYIGFFGAKEALCKYSDVTFEITGKAIEA